MSRVPTTKAPPPPLVGGSPAKANGADSSESYPLRSSWRWYQGTRVDGSVPRELATVTDMLVRDASLPRGVAARLSLHGRRTRRTLRERHGALVRWEADVMR